MGLRIFRYLLGIALLLAFIQILTTLHFSWSQSEQVTRRLSVNRINRLPLDHRPADHVLKNFKETKSLQSFAEDFVKDILAKYEDTKCTVQHKDAKSAVSRARSAQCKQIIRKTACLNEAKVLYFDNLHRTCPIKDTFYPRSVETMTAEGPPIRVVFMLTVHGRALRQIRRLLKTIYHKDHYYYFHVDSRSNYLYRNLVELSTSFPNIEVAPWRMATIWGGSSLLQMLLRALGDVIKKPEWKWDFFINLSGSDYPIKSNAQLTEFLRGHRNDNFLKSHGRENAKFIHKQGLDRTFVECDEHMWRIGGRTLPENIEIDGGSDWIGLNRMFAEYVINSPDTLVMGLKRMYAFALLPAESFFHTVLRNGPHCESFVRSNLRITNWKRKLGCRCQYKHVVDWCGCSPNDFKPGDIEKLKVSKFDLFARKFEAIINQRSINMVDELMFGASVWDTTALTSYWETFYHHIDDERGLSNAMRTYFASFSRIAARHVTSKYCANLPIGPTQEAAYFNQDDVFSGLLTLQTVRVPKRDRTVVLETWFKRRDPVKLNVNITGGPRRLKGLQVGTGWDQKERVLRNSDRFMGPMDEPVLVHYWQKGSPVFSVKLIWVDPIGVVAGVFEMRVLEDWVVSYQKPQYQKPLRPGIWTIKLIYRQTGGSDIVIGQTQFVIIPLAYRSTASFGTEDSVRVNNGPISSRYSKDYTVDFDRDLPNLDELAQEATANSKKTGQELHDWIDGLVSGYWHFEDACVVGELVSGCPELRTCEKTTWSTRSPDPKSDLSGINRDISS